MGEGVIEGHPDHPAKKSYFYSSKGKAIRQAENFEKLGFHANSTIDNSTYLTAFLVCWLCGYVFLVSSTIIRPETFLMAKELYKREEI